MKKIIILTIFSLIFLASCSESKITLEETKINISEKVNVKEINKEITRIPKRDEVMVNRLLEGLTSNNDKKIFLDYKNLKINRNELKGKLEELKKEKKQKLNEINISGDIELINKITEELKVLENFRL